MSDAKLILHGDAPLPLPYHFWYSPAIGIRRGLCKQEFFCEISVQFIEIFPSKIYQWKLTALIAASFSQDMQTSHQVGYKKNNLLNWKKN